MSDNGSAPKDWATPRLRGIIEKARARRMAFKEIDFSQFDSELEGQSVRVWVNAPSALARAFAEFNMGDTVPALSEYLYHMDGEPYTASDLQDLFDAWPGALRPWFVKQVFAKLTEYNQERADFFDSSETASRSKEPSPKETSS